MFGLGMVMLSDSASNSAARCGNSHAIADADFKRLHMM